MAHMWPPYAKPWWKRTWVNGFPRIYCTISLNWNLLTQYIISLYDLIKHSSGIPYSNTSLCNNSSEPHTTMIMMSVTAMTMMTLKKMMFRIVPLLLLGLAASSPVSLNYYYYKGERDLSSCSLARILSSKLLLCNNDDVVSPGLRWPSLSTEHFRPLEMDFTAIAQLLEIVHISCQQTSPTILANIQCNTPH